ncbi:MAG: hypothetical protein J6Y62_03890 [Clostridia bacterium]|nr:hypothetical protein [Clostridia bacterium]
MRLSDCRTDKDFSEFCRAASPCYIEDGAVCFESWGRLRVKREGGRYRAYLQGKPLNDLYDERDLMESRRIRLLLRLRLLKIRYWRVKLKRELNEDGLTWDFWGEKLLGLFYSREFIDERVRLVKDFDNPFDETGGFEVEGIAKRYAEKPAVKRRMLTAAEEQSAMQCKKWKEWLAALQKDKMRKKAGETEES